MELPKEKTPKPPKKLKYGCTINTTEDIGLLQGLGAKKVGQIIKTSKEPRINWYETWRPKKGFCKDYDLSQTHFIVDSTKGPKFIVKDTTVSYVPSNNPPKNGKKKKKQGMGPQWEFLDETMKSREDAKQAKALALLKKRINRKRRREDELDRKITYNILCRNLKKNPHVKLKFREPL